LKNLTLNVLRANFRHPKIRTVQEEMFTAIVDAKAGLVIEAPTGTGKTAAAMAALLSLAVQKKGPLYYVTPTKTLVDQLARDFPQAAKIMGRAEYPCAYYTSRGVTNVTALDSPCYMLKCPHRVDQETGLTTEPGAEPCAYFQAKRNAWVRARNGGVVVCTTAFFLLNRLMVPGWKEEDPELVVADEAHRLAKVARSIFEYTLTDHHLRRLFKVLKEMDTDQAGIILAFYKCFMRMALRRQSNTPVLLKEEEIRRLIGIMEQLDVVRVRSLMDKALESGKLDPVVDREVLKLLENLLQNIPRFVVSLGFALEEGDRKPLNYVVAFYYRKDDVEFANTKKRARYFLTIRSYFVAPIIRKAFGSNVIACSATIGNADIWKHETGLRLPFRAFGSNFPSSRTRIFMPTDTPNLSAKTRRRDDVKKALKLIADAAKKFAASGRRSLVVVVSEDERVRFAKYAAERKLEVVTYGNGVKAREAAATFVAGTGQVLLGTVAHFGEGIDLPRGIAPVIFFLRPGYAPPTSPETQFEQRRFGQSHCWALWNWRVTIEALQARGRNIRTAHDLGVCFFISAQFRRFLYAGLPEWLRPACRSNVTTAQAIEETLKLLE